MFIRELLFEIDVEKTLDQYGDQLIIRVSRDLGSSGLDSAEKVIQYIMDYDPTRKKSFSLWMVEKYLSGGISSLSNLDQVREYLIQYARLKLNRKLKSNHVDINNISSLESLKKVVEQYREPNTSTMSDRELEQYFYKEGEAELVYNSDHIKVVVPLSIRTSCFFGRNTKWCTVSTHAENQFQKYFRYGKLYILLLKRENSRFQFHFEYDEFVDELNKPIEVETWKNLRERFPVLLDIFGKLAKKHSSWFLIKDLDSDIENFEEYMYLSKGKVIALLKNPSWQIQYESFFISLTNIQLIENPHPMALEKIINKYPGSIGYVKNPSEHLKYIAIEKEPALIKYMDDPSETLQLLAISKNSYILDYIKNPTEKVLLHLLEKNPESLWIWFDIDKSNRIEFFSEKIKSEIFNLYKSSRGRENPYIKKLVDAI